MSTCTRVFGYDVWLPGDDAVLEEGCSVPAEVAGSRDTQDYGVPLPKLSGANQAHLQEKALELVQEIEERHEQRGS